MTRYLLTLTALILAASIGAFFKYVSLFSILSSVFVGLGMVSIFGLGAYVGFDQARRTWRIEDDVVTVDGEEGEPELRRAA